MAYFYFSIFLSAFLLFMVEPLIGKTILPWFGGSAAVWSAVMLFFQLLLTGGYAYAAWLTRGSKRNIVHLIILGASLLLMSPLGLIWRSPVTPPGSLRFAASDPPILAIFIFLGLSTGLPFFLLASNSTLTQAWFQRFFPDRTAYRLYALSNASSLIALVSYPILIEPNLSLPWQGWVWSLAYLVFAGFSLFWTIRVMRLLQPVHPQAAETTARPSTRDYVLWLALSACASLLLLAVTNYLTQQVAVVPFLWVLPLALYLLSFVLAFSGERWYPRKVFIFGLVPVILLYDFAMANGGRVGVPFQVAIFGLVLFLGCMVCNGELYRLRPSAPFLPRFYLIISIGGAFGGILINFAAPSLFKGYWELPVGILLFCILFLIVGREPKKQSLRGEIVHLLSFAFLVMAVLITLVRLFAFIGSDLANSVQSSRNFYGVVHVRQVGSPGTSDYSYQLINGSTIHGAEFLGQGERGTPTVYYGPSSGVGLALLNHPRSPAGLRVGALGLGVGTIAAYGQPGDRYRFYEINPTVIQLAEGQGGYFTFLSDSRAKIEIVSGDARLSLEQELAEGQALSYDVLVLDVFSNDSVPVHLLDEQAFSIYLQCLQFDGVLAIHITNAYLDLVPVVWTLADHFQLDRSLIVDPGDGHYTSASTWVLLARDPALLSIPAISDRAKDMTGYKPSIRMWTDDYSNLFQILKR